MSVYHLNEIDVLFWQIREESCTDPNFTRYCGHTFEEEVAVLSQLHTQCVSEYNSKSIFKSATNFPVIIKITKRLRGCGCFLTHGVHKEQAIIAFVISHV